MKHTRQYSNKQLRALKLKGHDIHPVFGRPVELVTLDYRPRTKFDPKPWVWGADGIRFSAWELTATPHVPSRAELADQRHVLEDHSPLDVAFSHLADRVGTEAVAA